MLKTKIIDIIGNHIKFIIEKRKECELAIESNPHNASAHFGLAKLLENSYCDYEKAKKHY